MDLIRLKNSRKEVAIEVDRAQGHVARNRRSFSWRRLWSIFTLVMRRLLVAYVTGEEIAMTDQPQEDEEAQSNFAFQAKLAERLHQAASGE